MKYKGNKHIRKIFYSGESIGADNNADYNITFDDDSVNNCRLPIWLCYMDNKLIEISNDRKNNKNNIINININKIKLFCSFIAQGPTYHRTEFIKKLSEYKQVDCGGKYLNNIGYVVPRGIDSSGKIEHNSKYKFAMAFENTDFPNYCTEKICDIYKSGCIPIYWGNKNVVKDFNPSTFINANDFNNLDELVQHIKLVDLDDTLYESYFKEQIFTDYWLNIFNDPNKTFFKTLTNNIIYDSIR